MASTVLTTSRLSRIAAILIIGRLVYVWAGASKPTPFSPSPAPAFTPGPDTQAVYKKDPLLEAIKLADKGDDAGSEAALKAILKAGENGGAHNALGVLYFREKKVKEALAEFDRAVTVDPKLADAFFNRATARDATGDSAGALADYSKVLKLKPQAPGQTELAAREVKRLTPDAGGKKK